MELEEIWDSAPGGQSSGTAIIGGAYCEEQGPPCGQGRFRFCPAAGVFEIEEFEVFGETDLTDRLVCTFGQFEYVPIGNDRWSVEHPQLILGTVYGRSAVFGCLADADEDGIYCGPYRPLNDPLEKTCDSPCMGGLL